MSESPNARDEGRPADRGDDDALGWHVISGSHLLETLRRCHDGESPDLVFAELWANAEREPSQ